MDNSTPLSVNNSSAVTGSQQKHTTLVSAELILPATEQAHLSETYAALDTLRTAPRAAALKAIFAYGGKEKVAQ
ncbi:hypothetical protein GA0116948_112112 [Chitinophaga costaii]|uniref:Uncharacterized protein n=1 Tax=Chitinophaga costaii TaxID=1335309 RepID=A0A1C4F8R9_9BACT|nr:hypothetical protein [Chitinophaga costaii]PUZ21184.1 hypothetical protein DCM91_16690 [Chitinophaga costaii]SCC52300.1 hypothetical protein GA0116948_112112 [Chitinophaga costaii]